jgi:hypothetical protein
MQLSVEAIRSALGGAKIDHLVRVLSLGTRHAHY